MSLEGQIRKLSTQAAVSESPEELHDVMAELRVALREQHLHAKNLITQQSLSSRIGRQDVDSIDLPDEKHSSKKKKAKEKEGRIYFFFLSGWS